jgi:hypothetical protein
MRASSCVKKDAEVVNSFIASYRAASRSFILYPLLILLGLVSYDYIFFPGVAASEKPFTLVSSFLMAGLTFFWCKGFYDFMFGNARCPQCKSWITVSPFFLGVVEIKVLKGIPLLERQIKRCHKCDYPLSLAELEKDLAAEQAAQELATQADAKV